MSDATARFALVHGASEGDWRHSARLIRADDIDIEIDDDSNVTVCDEDPATLGAWVQAWVFVPLARLRYAENGSQPLT